MQFQFYIIQNARERKRKSYSKEGFTSCMYENRRLLYNATFKAPQLFSPWDACPTRRDHDGT